MRIPATLIGALLASAIMSAPSRAADAPPPAPPPEIRIPKSAQNHLLDATLSGNMDSFGKGTRGAPVNAVYDLQRGRFAQWGQWNEYGVGQNEDIGVVPEDKAAFWMAEWPAPVRVNYIRLSGAYANQPQPDTAWKIELRSEGTWRIHERGVGGWYNAGRYTWGGPDAKPLTIDAFRVSLFSKDDKTALKSIHVRGEDGLSWVVGYLPSIDARIVRPDKRVREGRPATFRARAAAGDIQTWTWTFASGKPESGPETTHTFWLSGYQEIRLAFSDGKEDAAVIGQIRVWFPIEARVTPLAAPVIAGRPAEFAADTSVGRPLSWGWNFGDGAMGSGQKVSHTFKEPGIYRVLLRAADATHVDEGFAIVRVHTPDTLHVPQLHLDTDAANGCDDQHALAYALLSEADVLAVNSVHHGGGQEAANFKEINRVLTLALHSGRHARPAPLVFRGADWPLAEPETAAWTETEPSRTPAAGALLASARGACPANPVWWLAIGPGTNIASAILRAREQDLDLKDRVRIVWMGGTKDDVRGQFNGDHDPWSLAVIAQSGIDTWIVPDAAGALQVAKPADADLYPKNYLGDYLRRIAPGGPDPKPLYDPACVALVIAQRLGLGWVKQSEPITVDPKTLAWVPAKGPSAVRVVREFDPKEIKTDLFSTLGGKPLRMLGLPPAKTTVK